MKYLCDDCLKPDPEFEVEVQAHDAALTAKCGAHLKCLPLVIGKHAIKYNARQFTLRAIDAEGVIP